LFFLPLPPARPFLGSRSPPCPIMKRYSNTRPDGPAEMEPTPRPWGATDSCGFLGTPWLER
jgi:hypothetical protein